MEGKGQDMRRDRQAENLFICAGIGALAFVFLYGLDSLHVAFDQWILNGYVEEDIIQHYAGWMAFRDSPWGFPLGLAGNLGYPSGVVISFTDSIPLVSLFFKCFSKILPETFQFFGWYTLGCFVMQGTAAGLLAGLFTRRRWGIFGICILFVFSPILIERAFRHTALASQWLVLLALYAYFHGKRVQKIPWMFLVLNFLCVGIHPYFLPMVCGIQAAWTLEWLMQDRKIRKEGGGLAVTGRQVLLFWLGNIFAVGIGGYVLGLFGSGMSGVSSGFGYYSMNLNAPVNPSSIGMEGWSVFLPVLPQLSGNYDGFNYLGAGVLLFGGAAVSGKAAALGREGRLGRFVKSYGGLLLFFVFCCLFAVSNIVTLGERELWRIPLPEAVERICSVFRASGRMFYPVYEMLFLMAGLFAVELFERLPFAWSRRCPKWTALVILLCLQLWDLSPALAQKRGSIDASHMEAGSYDPGLYQSQDWAQLLGAYKRVELLNYHHDYNLSAFLMKHHVQSNILPANRGDFTAAEERCQAMIWEIYEGAAMEEGVLYITNSPSLAAQLQWNLNEGMAAYDLGEYTAFGRRQEGITGKEAVLEGEKGRFAVIAADSPDWLYLRGTEENELLFPYTAVLERELAEGAALRMGEDTVEILGMEIYSNDYIQDYIYVQCREGTDLTKWREAEGIEIEDTQRR